MSLEEFVGNISFIVIYLRSLVISELLGLTMG